MALPKQTFTFYSLQGQALRVCPGLPKSASSAGTIAGAHNLPIIAYEGLETVRTHIRQRAQQVNQHLTHVKFTHPTSHWDRLLLQHHAHMPEDAIR